MTNEALSAKAVVHADMARKNLLCRTSHIVIGWQVVNRSHLSFPSWARRYRSVRGLVLRFGRGGGHRAVRQNRPLYLPARQRKVMADSQGASRGGVTELSREATSPREPSRRCRKDGASPEGVLKQLGWSAPPVASLKHNLRQAKSGSQRGERPGKRYPDSPFVPRDFNASNGHASGLHTQALRKLDLAQAKLASPPRDQLADRCAPCRHVVLLSLADPRPGVQSRSGGALNSSASISDDNLVSCCRRFPSKGAVAIACQLSAAITMHMVNHIGPC
jgi:hypothetical protein